MSQTCERYRKTWPARVSVICWFVCVRTERFGGHQTYILLEQLDSLPLSPNSPHFESQNSSVLYSRENFAYLYVAGGLSQSERAATTGNLQYKINVDVNRPIASTADVLCHSTALIAVAGSLQLVLVLANKLLMIHTGTCRFSLIITRYGHFLTR